MQYNFELFICAVFTTEIKFDFCISIQGTLGWVGDSVDVCEDGLWTMLGP